MINAQHAHIYRIHTLHFIFGEIFFPKILSIQPLLLVSISAKYSISEYFDDFFFTSSKYSHHEYFTIHQKNQIINILQSLISNSLLLAPCIVRTFEKSLTAADIIKFTEEDEMKYLIIKHSSGN